jgi:hypothetical protein
VPKIKARPKKSRHKKALTPALPTPILCFAPDYLLDRTGKTTAYWLVRVEALIRECSTEPVDVAPGYSKHGSTDVRYWHAALLGEVLQHFPSGRLIDENMWTASVLGCILATWYARLQWGKACDPVRPVADRVPAYNRHVEFIVSLGVALSNPANDATVWPNQTWQSPFTPNATSGSFR